MLSSLEFGYKLGMKTTIFWIVGCCTTVNTRPSGHGAGKPGKHSPTAARVRKHSSTKLQVGIGYLVKLLFFGMRPIVVHGRGMVN